MFWATDANGERVAATPEALATCPLCGSPVFAKCGPVVTWHWAHRSNRDCDAWSEPESAWHRDWKALAGPDCGVEVTMGPHRADIVTRRGVLELQHSRIKASEIAKREAFYGDMEWLLDGSGWARSELSYGTVYKPGSVSFRWRRMPTSWRVATKPIWIDLGWLGEWCDDLDPESQQFGNVVFAGSCGIGEGYYVFEVYKLYRDSTVAGWGRFWTYERFRYRFGLTEGLTQREYAARNLRDPWAPYHNGRWREPATAGGR